METKIEEKKDISLEMVKNYLQKASKHLYITEQKQVFKVFPIQTNDNYYYVTLKFDGNNSYVQITNINLYADAQGKYVKTLKNEIGNSLFPQHYNRKNSIPNFKIAREKISEVKQYIENNFNGMNKKEIEAEMEKQLTGLELRETQEA